VFAKALLNQGRRTCDVCEGLASTGRSPAPATNDVNRGKRRKAQGEGPLSIEGFSEVSDAVAKRAWVRLIKQV
jgi:hypothetical protein